MVPTLEAIKGGGGSIKVGATGRISSLMSRELESAKSAPEKNVSSRNKSPTGSNSVASTPKRPKPRTLDEASSSSSSSSNKRSPEIARKKKQHNQKTHQIPMLASDNILIDGTPRRDKADKRSSYIVEVVDIKCSNADRTWASPLTNRLKKLGFSKLSESIA